MHLNLVATADLAHQDSIRKAFCMPRVPSRRSHHRGERFSAGLTRCFRRRAGDDTAALATELDMAGEGYTTHYSRLPAL